MKLLEENKHIEETVYIRLPALCIKLYFFKTNEHLIKRHLLNEIFRFFKG